jgi:dsDNA-specific endonuclease/ATPase MutS2
MITHTFQVLGYHNLVDILYYYTSCSVGPSEHLSLKPSNDSRNINKQLSLISEMKLLLKTKRFVSLSDLTDIVPLLRRSTAEGFPIGPGLQYWWGGIPVHLKGAFL